eukprot:TRINITY_DN15744_c0_g3_i3.p1 TRINITY_DN15744_c0_g3~~TRINITY_DN15744_c0_g3_i3.p1  ORF type:complete len:122 (+),score=8.71 TRINITY_DN15744_c0_g3_i3:232-597(+)
MHTCIPWFFVFAERRFHKVSKAVHCLYCLSYQPFINFSMLVPKIFGYLTMTLGEKPTTLSRSSVTFEFFSKYLGFVLWQMMPDMWYVELAVGGSKVHAGSNGKLVWRHTPWLGARAGLLGP